MISRAQIRLLPDGRRLHLNDGPIDLIVEAFGSRDEVQSSYRAASKRFVTVLDELCSELRILRGRCTQESEWPRGSVARRMTAAVMPYATRCFVTPMAAVAGAVAEEIMAAMLSAARLTRAYVNNGGDIALHLAAKEKFVIGLIDRPDPPSLLGTTTIGASDPVRGIATSGWRGRSFSLGIADAVTILAANAAAADAAATIVANAVDIPGHPAITRVPAREHSPDSDLRDLQVTQAVSELHPEEVDQALDHGVRTAQILQRLGLIHSAALSLQHEVRIVESHGDRAIAPAPERTLVHA